MQKTIQTARGITPVSGSERKGLDARIREFGRLLEPQLIRPMGMVETVRNCHENGLALVPHADFEHIRRLPQNGYSKVRTGTLVIHERDGKPFGDEVVSGGDFNSPERLVFPVPRQYRGRHGWLVAISPHFDIVEWAAECRVMVPEGRLVHVERAPAYGGTFWRDDDTGVPIGDRVRENGGAKPGMVAISNKIEPCIDLIVRDINSSHIYLDVGTSDQLKALVRLAITPENYAERVAGLVKAGANGRMAAFVREWASEDPALAEALRG